jgi:hypothetical protein
LTLTEYQAGLTALAQAVRPAVDRVLAAGSLADIDAARVDLAAVLEKQWDVAGSMVPPEGLQEAHRDLLATLSVGPTLRTLAPTHATSSCGAEADLPTRLHEARRDVYHTVDSASLTLARTALAASNLTLDGMLPPAPQAPPAQDRRAANGQIIQRTGARGSGRLEITNGTSEDFAVSVVIGDPAKPQVMVYVWAGSKATVTRIAGTYQVYLKSGSDWDPQLRGFTGNCAFEKFDESFDQGSDWEISLQKTVVGNARTSTVPAF